MEQLSVPRNLGLLKKEVYNYFESGDYEKMVTCIVNDIKSYFNTSDKFPRDNSNSAVVFDIDDTVLSTWPYYKQNNFAYDRQKIEKWERSECLIAIKPMLELFHFLREREYEIFFVSGRKKCLRTHTIRNLHKAGFYGWRDIIMRDNNDNRPSRISFKQSARQSIENRGFNIIATIGDQNSDLIGGFSGRIFKMPNPIYYIP